MVLSFSMSGEGREGLVRTRSGPPACAKAGGTCESMCVTHAQASCVHSSQPFPRSVGLCAGHQHDRAINEQLMEAWPGWQIIRTSCYPYDAAGVTAITPRKQR